MRTEEQLSSDQKQKVVTSQMSNTLLILGA